MGCRRLQFIGGEPTIHPDLPRLLEHARARRFQAVRSLHECHAPPGGSRSNLQRLGVLVHFSFYSFDPARARPDYGPEGSFERTVEGIRQLVRRRSLACGGRHHPFQSNAVHLEENEKVPPGSRGPRDWHRSRARRRARRAVRAGALERSDELCGQCWSGKLCIDADGDAHPCVFSRFVSVGNVLEEELRTIVSGRKAARLPARDVPWKSRRVGMGDLFCRPAWQEFKAATADPNRSGSAVVLGVIRDLAGAAAPGLAATGLAPGGRHALQLLEPVQDEVDPRWRVAARHLLHHHERLPIRQRVVGAVRAVEELAWSAGEGGPVWSR